MLVLNFQPIKEKTGIGYFDNIFVNDDEFREATTDEVVIAKLSDKYYEPSHFGANAVGTKNQPRYFISYIKDNERIDIRNVYVKHMKNYIDAVHVRINDYETDQFYPDKTIFTDRIIQRYYEILGNQKIFWF